MTEHARDEAFPSLAPARRPGACRPAGKVHRAVAAMPVARVVPSPRVARAPEAGPFVPGRTLEHVAALEQRFDADAVAPERISPLAAGVGTAPTRIRRMPAVQRTAAAPVAAPAVHVRVDAGAPRNVIRRHASKEHFLLGNMAPHDLKKLAEAKGKAEQDNTVVNKVWSWFSKPDPPKPEVLAAIQTIDEQLAGLDKWRTATVDNPSPDDIDLGGTGGDDFSHEWGGQLVTVPCLDGALVCTTSDLNALPDFFGSYDDLGKVDRVVAFRTFQVIRRETWVYLKQLKALLEGKSYSYDKKAKGEGFNELEDNDVSLSNSLLPKFGNDAADVLQTATMMRGKEGETGLDDSIGAEATLGRNACHFPPESWLRWREYHTKARQLIASANSLNDLPAKANEAIGRNAFGEHYLQDSFAAGHLINKGFVMACAMEFASDHSKEIMGMTPERIQELQGATKHSEAYAIPEAAQEKETAREWGEYEPVNAIDDVSIKARDPQSALESASETFERTDDSTAARVEEMAASGINPESMSFEQYRMWLNDFWLQKITNSLHDKYCVNGLEVMSPDNPHLFKIYGDSHMMESPEGTRYTAFTSQLSKSAINILVENRRAELTAQENGGEPVGIKPVPSVESILARFPNTVKDDDGTVMSLENWATGEPMRKKIESLVSGMESITEGKLTAIVRLASTFKVVAEGLKPEHGPF